MEELKALAARLLETGEGAEAFERCVGSCDHGELLHTLALEYTPHSEVSMPIYRRLEQLRPHDPQIAAEFGFVHWLCGDDSQAREQASRAESLDGDNIDGILLRAALATGVAEKEALYRRVLDIDADHAVAKENLNRLASPTN